MPIRMLGFTRRPRAFRWCLNEATDCPNMPVFQFENRTMKYIPIWIDQRPITAVLLLSLFLAMVFMVIIWWKDLEYLTCPKDHCSDEYLVKYFLFHGAKLSLIVLSLTGIFFKFRGVFAYWYW